MAADVFGYGINNSVIDNKILETENGLSEYVIGTDIGEYSKTR